VSLPPSQQKIYHITHVKNLPSILEAEGLWSDAVMLDRGGPTASIGMGSIKQRRMGLPVKCHEGDKVGEYVPFYFGPRSVMLYLISMANHPELAYRGGQGPIVHLEADLDDAINWARSDGRRWAFSLGNAGAAYTEFRKRRDQLDELDWDAARATDWRDPDVKERKQAEFLVYEFFPWELVRRIGVYSPTVHSQVIRTLAGHAHRPDVKVRTDWYY
jgi:hypothetical protein